MLKSAKKVAAKLSNKESSKPLKMPGLEVPSFWPFCKKVAANGHTRPETTKIPRSEEQGNDLESLDFPGKISAWRTEAHDGQPSGRTLLEIGSITLLFHNII